ncbi:hypothetical protein [Ensifer canadensis]|uniref:hypothetical protein n=1 Tax=Ensifer canadensis TaxID=555315 RepID=UPI0035E3CA52
MAELISIDKNNISQGKEPGVLMIGVRVQEGEEEFDAVHALVPGDQYGFSPAIREWLDENAGEFEVAPFVPPTDEEVRDAMPQLSARQLRLGLLNAGISPSSVSATIAAMPSGPDRDKAQVEWEYATTFNRTHPLIATVGGALGLNDTQIDAMWLAAVSL